MEDKKKNEPHLPEHYTVEQFELWFMMQDRKLSNEYKQFLEAKYKLLTADVRDQYAERMEKQIQKPKTMESEWPK